MLLHLQVVADDEEGALDLSYIEKQASPAPRSPVASEGDFDEAEFSSNSKHFSRNARLLDANTVEVVARRSLRLSPTPKHKAHPKKAPVSVSHKGKALVDTPKKSSASAVKKLQGSSSCADTAPVAKLKPSKVLKKGKPSMQTESTAEDRMRAYEQAKELELSNASKASSNQGSTAADRRSAMASTSKGPVGYEVTVDDKQAWYDKQGSGYRRLQEQHKKKKEKEKDDAFLAQMKEKNETLKELTAGMQNLKNTGGGGTVGPVSAEQLWTDSLVPQLQRMDTNTKDDFMLHVSMLALKAIRGKWSP